MTNSSAPRTKLLGLLPLACVSLVVALLFSAAAQAAEPSASSFRSVITACIQLLNSDQALGGAPSLARVGFHPVASANPYGGSGGGFGPSTRTYSILSHEAQAVREGEQYTFRPALAGNMPLGSAYGPATTWILSPLSQGSHGQGPGFFLMYPERGLSRQEVEWLLGEMQSLASSWVGSQIDNATWVWDFTTSPHSAPPGGNRLSCYYSTDAQGLYQTTLVLRRDAQATRQPLRGRGPGPHKAHSPGSFTRGVFN